MGSEPSSQHFSKPQAAPPALPTMTTRKPRILTRGSAQSLPRPLMSTKETNEHFRKAE